jgi:hypothetical protein
MNKIIVLIFTAILAANACAYMGQVLNSWPAPGAYLQINGITPQGEYIWLKSRYCEEGGVYKCTTNGSVLNNVGFPYHGYNESSGLAFDGQYLWTIYYQPSGTPTYDCYAKYTTNGSNVAGFSLHPGKSGYTKSVSWDGQYLWTDEWQYTPLKAGKYTTAGSLVGTFAIAPNWNTAAGYYNHQLWAGGDDGYIYGMAIGASTLAGSFAAPGGSCAAVGFDGEYLWTADKNTPQYIYKIDIDVVDVNPDSFGKIKGIYR